MELGSGAALNTGLQTGLSEATLGECQCEEQFRTLSPITLSLDFKPPSPTPSPNPFGTGTQETWHIQYTNAPQSQQTMYTGHGPSVISSSSQRTR